jgi:HEAT repeat protein
MNLLSSLERATAIMGSVSVILAGLSLIAVIAERSSIALWSIRRRRSERRYLPIIRRALDADDSACRTLAACPTRHRLLIAELMILPLIHDRDPDRITRTRTIVRAMSLVDDADRYLQSRLWWRRALALRALGLTQIRERTGSIVAALDDPNPDVRGAALDALSDLKDPASLQAVVVRLNDMSLHRGRIVAALAALGTQCEPFLLDLASVDPVHRSNYARALAICGTARARADLVLWTRDTRVEVRAAAFESLAHVGLDDRAAAMAIEGLESGDPAVRAMAARALNGWTGSSEAASRLARHLGDTWTVAVSAGRSLQSMGAAGLVELETAAARSDLAGLLARQMLWEERAEC